MFQSCKLGFWYCSPYDNAFSVYKVSVSSQFWIGFKSLCSSVTQSICTETNYIAMELLVDQTISGLRSCEVHLYVDTFNLTSFLNLKFSSKLLLPLFWNSSNRNSWFLIFEIVDIRILYPSAKLFTLFGYVNSFSKYVFLCNIIGKHSNWIHLVLLKPIFFHR